MTQPPQGNDPAPDGGQPPSHQPPPDGGEPGGPSGADQQPPKRSTGLVVAIVVAALLVTAGAVGGVVLLTGDDESDSPSTATEESTSAPTTSAETASADPTTSAAPPTSVVSPIGDAYCQKLKGYDRDEGLKSLDFSTRAAQQKIVDILEDLESEAPSQLKDDYEVVIDGFVSIRDQKPQEIDQAEFTEAFRQIGKDAEKNCGVDMGR